MYISLGGGDYLIAPNRLRCPQEHSLSPYVTPPPQPSPAVPNKPPKPGVGPENQSGEENDKPSMILAHTYCDQCGVLSVQGSVMQICHNCDWKACDSCCQSSNQSFVSIESGPTLAIGDHDT